MTKLTLLTKAYSTKQLAQIDNQLRQTLEGLDVAAKRADYSVNTWVQISLVGEDEAIATNLLRKEIGFCPINIQNVKQHVNMKGYIVEQGKNFDNLQVDVGIFQPIPITVSIPFRHLQATLVDGRKVALKKIIELFGFCTGLPITIKTILVDKENNRIEAELATSQLEKLKGWQESLLDRLILLGASLIEIKTMLSYTGLNRDIINIETLGLFEHALTCKLGTDAAGLIATIGRGMKQAKFIVFNPRKINQFSEITIAT
jgi:hypothetical protein